MLYRYLVSKREEGKSRRKRNSNWPSFLLPLSPAGTRLIVECEPENVQLWMRSSSDFFYFDQEMQFTYVQATGEASIQPSKKNTQQVKKLNLLTFPFFVGHFCPPGSGHGSRDSIESGSIPDPDPQHC
jgi:hypothetical protein